MLSPTSKAIKFFINNIKNLRNNHRLAVSNNERQILYDDSEVTEKKINVQGFKINYVQVGNGTDPILLLPGAAGSIWTDFEPQLNGLDRNKLTIVAWDPPGYGKSRPPNRIFGDNFLPRDASVAHDLMKTLGFDKFSLLGFSNGAVTSLFLAANYPESIKKMIVTGSRSYITPDELKNYKSIRNIDTWKNSRRGRQLSNMNGEEYFRSTWASWIDAMISMYEKNNGDICTNVLPKIQCPTLIVHGAKDDLVHEDHPEFLAKNIKNSEVRIFDQGTHTLHLKYHEEFNRLSMKFLLEN